MSEAVSGSTKGWVCQAEATGRRISFPERPFAALRVTELVVSLLHVFRLNLSLSVS